MVSPVIISRIEEITERAVAVVSERPFTANDAHGDVSESQKAKKNIICDACTQLLGVIDGLFTTAERSGFIKGDQIILSHSYADLRRSAWLGCHMCSIFERGTLQYLIEGRLSPVPAKGEDDGCDGWMFFHTASEWMSQPILKLLMGIIWTGTGTVQSNTGLWYISREHSTIQRPPNAPYRLEAPLAYDTGHDEVLQLASKWLSICRTEHKECHATRSAELNVPRRLLRLDDKYARIVDNTEQFEYTCLSHCWGSQENVPKQLFEEGPKKPFEIAKLPATFRDAMYVTRRLGFKYIWIDCFCILQHSRSDWLEQSAVMAQIYANSAITIAALSSTSVLGGCFNARNPLANHDLNVKGLVMEEQIGNRLRMWRLELDGDMERQSSLHTRGWVVQERLAARRTLFFGQNGVYWECKTMQAAENHCQLQDTAASENTKAFLDNLHNAAWESSGERPQGLDGTMFEKTWIKLVENYSACDLTRATDKLIALSGITNDIEKYCGRTFIHGLWAENLSEGLLWYHKYSSSMTSRVLSGGRIEIEDFPSWSWASMQGTVNHFNLFGRIVWRAPIRFERFSKQLWLTAWIRAIELDEDGEIIIPDDGSNRGDPTEFYGWYPDNLEPVKEPKWVVSVLRLSFSDDTSRGANACLVVRRVQDNIYSRVGAALLRFGSIRDDAFSREEPKEPQNSIILV